MDWLETLLNGANYALFIAACTCSGYVSHETRLTYITANLYVGRSRENEPRDSVGFCCSIQFDKLLCSQPDNLKGIDVVIFEKP